MRFEQLYRWSRHLPGPVRRVLRPFTSYYLERRVSPLSGALSGCRMRGDVQLDYRDGSYEPQVCQVLGRIVQHGWVCVDAGVHMGYFTLLLAKLVGAQGRVVAFEAHPQNAQRVRANVQLNGYEGYVQVENMAISDGSADSVCLFAGRGRSSAEWNIVGHDVEGRPSEAELRVRATSLDAYFPAGSRVDLVKLDVEGAEAQVLRGMRRLLHEARPCVMVEFHNEEGWEGRRELETEGYRLYNIADNRWHQESDTERAYHCLAVPPERFYEGMV